MVPLAARTNPMITHDSKDKGKSGNPFVSFSFNVLLPILILTRLSSESTLGPIYGLVAAISLPLTYGLYDFISKRTLNFFSGLGFVGILLTGSIGLLKLDPQWIAIKEAAIPMLIGLAVVGSVKTRFQLVRNFLSQIIRLDIVEEALTRQDDREEYDKRLVRSTYIIGASFILSALLNYFLARIIVISPAGTSEFNKELGQMTALSFPVIAIPSLIVLTIALIYLFRRITTLTGLEFQNLLRK